MPADIPELVAYIARSLSDDPDSVEVTEETRGRQNIVHLKVSDDDMGRIIGRDGRVANAIRSLLRAAPGDARWRLEIAD
jgi:predicted RNA-binding protein YlqC (UPF0109 family)